MSQHIYSYKTQASLGQDIISWFIHWSKLWINLCYLIYENRSNWGGKWQSEIYLNLSVGSGRLSVIKMYQLKSRTLSPGSYQCPLSFSVLFSLQYAPAVTEARVINYFSAAKNLLPTPAVHIFIWYTVSFYQNVGRRGNSMFYRSEFSVWKKKHCWLAVPKALPKHTPKTYSNAINVFATIHKTQKT